MLAHARREEKKNQGKAKVLKLAAEDVCSCDSTLMLQSATSHQC